MSGNSFFIFKFPYKSCVWVLSKIFTKLFIGSCPAFRYLRKASLLEIYSDDSKKVLAELKASFNSASLAFSTMDSILPV